MKRKTLYIILASVWAVALITLITVCVTAFGDKDKGGNSTTPPTQQEQNGGSQDEGDDENKDWTGNY